MSYHREQLHLQSVITQCATQCQEHVVAMKRFASLHSCKLCWFVLWVSNSLCPDTDVMF